MMRLESAANVKAYLQRAVVLTREQTHCQSRCLHVGTAYLVTFHRPII